MTRNEWHIKDVPEDTRRKVKAFAASNGLQLGAAITQLVDQALQAAAPANDTGNHKQSGTDKYTELGEEYGYSTLHPPM